MQTWTDKEIIAPGIVRYANIIRPEFNIINRLESVLGSTQNSKRYSWMPAYVGYKKLIPEYRDCVDFKFKRTDIEHDTSQDSLTLQAIWEDVYLQQFYAVENYREDYNLMDLEYWEAFNFIKYGPGQHFQEHHDHGYSYNCTVSLVSYINDNYEGGELYFRLQDLLIKPKAGDLYIFPSNYMYPHTALPVTSGIKYSIVTMLDYNPKFHTPEIHAEHID